jgi:hypothetical protein
MQATAANLGACATGLIARPALRPPKSAPAGAGVRTHGPRTVRSSPGARRNPHSRAPLERRPAGWPRLPPLKAFERRPRASPIPRARAGIRNPQQNRTLEQLQRSDIRSSFADARIRPSGTLGRDQGGDTESPLPVSADLRTGRPRRRVAAAGHPDRLSRERDFPGDNGAGSAGLKEPRRRARGPSFPKAENRRLDTPAR